MLIRCDTDSIVFTDCIVHLKHIHIFSLIILHVSSFPLTAKEDVYVSDGVYGVSVYLSNALKALREVADVSKRLKCLS